MASKTSPKSMDIQRPGAAKPDSSSRPIIVTNRPIMQDPMVKDTAKEPEEKDINEINLAGTSKIIAPPKVVEELKTAEKPTEITESEQATPESTDVPKAVDSIPEPEEPSSRDSAVVDAVVAGAAKPGDTADARQLEEAEAKRRQAVQVLIDSKQYAVSTGQVTRARHNRNAILLLVFMLAAVVGYAVIDIGIAQVPFEVPIHIFKQLI